ncbi:hypothetical protein [Paenibacillus thalictri]|uniref:hypothetical protein n=1 Tax=Paenibacillus thalictri TaxID=2527873 RepID=UPI0013EF1791|nr:hypothetical protein [Paenibacillus thalictri]
MSENNEQQKNEVSSVELTDLSEELSEQQLKEVQGGDLQTSSKPIVVKKVIRP